MKLRAILAMYSILGSAPGRAESAPDNSRASTQLLPPLTIDYEILYTNLNGKRI